MKGRHTGDGEGAVSCWREMKRKEKGAATGGEEKRGSREGGGVWLGVKSGRGRGSIV